MVELLALLFLAIFVWVAIKLVAKIVWPDQEGSGAARKPYKPDPLAHLDIKDSDVSIYSQGGEGNERGIFLEGSVFHAQIQRRGEPRENEFEFEIGYEDRNGRVTQRKIARVFHETKGTDTILHAYCGLARGDRKFFSSRIKSCVNLRTGRKIKDLGRYFRSGSHLR